MLKPYTWMEKESSKWSEVVMAQFIHDQNNHPNEYGQKTKHSAESLAQFAGLTDEQLVLFNKTYEQYYSTFTKF